MRIFAFNWEYAKVIFLINEDSSSHSVLNNVVQNVMEIKNLEWTCKLYWWIFLLFYISLNVKVVIRTRNRKLKNIIIIITMQYKYWGRFIVPRNGDCILLCITFFFILFVLSAYLLVSCLYFIFRYNCRR